MLPIRRLIKHPAAAALTLAALLIAPSSALAADEFPAGFEGYHTYAEVGAAATAATASRCPRD